MSALDEWCEFCNDRLKSKTVKSRKTDHAYGICKQCESLAIGMVEVKEELDQLERHES